MSESPEVPRRLREIADELDPPTRMPGPVPFKSEVDAAALLRHIADSTEQVVGRIDLKGKSYEEWEQEQRCPFCDYAGPSEILHDWGDAYAIEPLNPVVPGHVLIVAKPHVINFTPSPPTTAAVMQRAAEYACVEMRGDCNLITSAGAAATQTVKHLHVHLIPRSPGDGLALPWSPEPKDTAPEACTCGHHRPDSTWGHTGYCPLRSEDTAPERRKIEAELRRQHAAAHGSACECRAFEVEQVIAEHAAAEDTAPAQPLEEVERWLLRPAQTSWEKQEPDRPVVSVGPPVPTYTHVVSFEDYQKLSERLEEAQRQAKQQRLEGSYERMKEASSVALRERDRAIAVVRKLDDEAWQRYGKQKDDQRRAEQAEQRADSLEKRLREVRERLDREIEVAERISSRAHVEILKELRGVLLGSGGSCDAAEVFDGNDRTITVLDSEDSPDCGERSATQPVPTPDLRERLEEKARAARFTEEISGRRGATGDEAFHKGRRIAYESLARDLNTSGTSEEKCEICHDTGVEEADDEYQRPVDRPCPECSGTSGPTEGEER